MPRKYKFRIGDHVRYVCMDPSDTAHEFRGVTGVIRAHLSDGRNDFYTDWPISVPWRRYPARDWEAGDAELEYIGPAPRWSTNKLGDFPKKRGGRRGDIRSR